MSVKEVPGGDMLPVTCHVIETMFIIVNCISETVKFGLKYRIF